MFAIMTTISGGIFWFFKKSPSFNEVPPSNALLCVVVTDDDLLRDLLVFQFLNLNNSLSRSSLSSGRQLFYFTFTSFA